MQNKNESIQAPIKKTINEIPHKIHFFWTGSVVPDYAVKNIVSFLKHLPNSTWKVHLWLSNPNAFYKSTFFNEVENEKLPSSLILRDINELLNNHLLFLQLKMDFFSEDHMFSFSRVKEIINRELIGLGNPAAAKDGFAPLILFAEGGYFFDLDYKATSCFNPPSQAPYGFLILNSGRIVSALAAEKGHAFCAYALTFLVANYQILSFIEDTGSKYKTLQSKSFIESQIIRDRKNIERSKLTINTSGSIICQAYDQYIFENKTCSDLKSKLDFLNDTHFAIVDDTKLSIGVTPHLQQDGNWRNVKKFCFFDDSNIPDIKYSMDDSKSPSNKQLLKACKDGKIENVKKLLLNSFLNINTVNKEKCTPLYLACQEGHVNLIRVLLEQPTIDINKAEFEGATPLYIACQKGHIEIVKILLEQPTLNSIDQIGLRNHTPLLVACCSPDTVNKEELFNILLNKGASIFHKNNKSKTALDIAVSTNNNSAIRAILMFAEDRKIPLNMIMSSKTKNKISSLINNLISEPEATLRYT